MSFAARPLISTAGAVIALNGYPNAGDPGIVLYMEDEKISPGTASATVTIELNSSGVATYSFDSLNTSSGNFVTFNWLTGGVAGEYYAFMDTPSSGTFSTGTVNTNLQLNTTRTWTATVTRSTVGITLKNVLSVLRIRNSSFADIVTKNVDMTAKATVAL